jgi:hypothetical protein
MTPEHGPRELKTPEELCERGKHLRAIHREVCEASREAQRLAATAIERARALVDASSSNRGRGKTAP